MQDAAGMTAHDHHGRLAATIGEYVDELHASDVMQVQIDEHHAPVTLTEGLDSSITLVHAFDRTNTQLGQRLLQRCQMDLIGIHHQCGGNRMHLSKGKGVTNLCVHGGRLRAAGKVSQVVFVGRHCSNR